MYLGISSKLKAKCRTNKCYRYTYCLHLVLSIYNCFDVFSLQKCRVGCLPSRANHRTASADRYVATAPHIQLCIVMTLRCRSSPLAFNQHPCSSLLVCSFQSAYITKLCTVVYHALILKHFSYQ